MSSFKLSQRSRTNLQGVKPQLVAVVERAIQLTKIDFAVTEGLRTEAQQRQLVAKGASQTMNSKHLRGEAVDLVAYIDGRISWELNLYDDIADAMKAAALELGVPLKWGAAWNVVDVTQWAGTMESAMNYYIDERRKQGRRPFIDAPHFERV
jgi:peptidoglycan L-alanyl-D-glutamate endopeptidase CwlK